MPRKKKTAAAKALAALEALTGIEAPKELEHLIDQSQVEEENKKLTKSLALESALHYLDNPKVFKRLECKLCGGVFATTMEGIRFCSDPCRIREFKNRTGMDWNKNVPLQERWNNTIPPVVVPSILESLAPHVTEEEVLVPS